MPRFPAAVNKTSVFAGLMLLSAAAVAAPSGWTDWLKGVTQLLVPAQAVLHAAGAKAVRSLSRADRSPGAGGATAPTTQLAALERELLFQSGLVERLRRENAALRGLRDEYIAPSVRLIPARVVARDMVAARDSALLARGATRGVRWHDWVVSRSFIDAGGHEGVERGFPVLAREALVGRVEFVHPYMSRVALLSDVDARTAVRVGRAIDGGFQMVDYPATLRGRGRGRMVIEDVPQRYIADAAHASDADRIREGDLVVTAPDAPGLAAPLVIGRVTAITDDPRKRLVYTVEVEPAVRGEDLLDVYVVAGLPGRDDLLGALGP
jgi:cell shape-determining protein MreC